MTLPGRRRLRRALATVVLAIAACAPPQEFVLTRDSEAGFAKVIERARTGGLGSNVAIRSVSTERGRARIEIGVSGRSLGVSLSRASGRWGGAPRWFHVQPDSPVATGDEVVLTRLAALLDQGFSDDPWTEAEARVEDDPTCPPGGGQDLKCTVKRWEPIVSRRYVGLLGLVLLGALLIACRSVVIAAPRREEQTAEPPR